MSDENELRQLLNYFNPWSLGEDLEEWRKKREEMVEALDDREMDRELYDEMSEIVEIAETLSSNLDTLAELVGLELEPLQSALKKYFDAHEDKLW